MEANKKIRLGAGAGFSGDRIEPAVDLAQNANIDYLIFECLAERTIALAQERKRTKHQAGYDPLLAERMEACLRVCKDNKVKIISNMGAANPISAMQKTAKVANNLGIAGLKIAAVTGDDVLSSIGSLPVEMMNSEVDFEQIKPKIISANAYLGAQGILEALKEDADIILTGRVADPALFLAPMIHEFQWSANAYDLLGKGILVGHLLECAGQLTGGYFADPGLKEIPDLANLGFPIAEVTADGHATFTKLPESGGSISVATCKEQLLYEIHDPKNYLTPDVIADFSKVTFNQLSQNNVKAEGATGRKKTGKLKVSVGYLYGYIGEGQISYGGGGAVNRAKLAADIIKHRLKRIGVCYSEIRIDIIGLNSLYNETLAPNNPNEVRLRITVKTNNNKDALRAANEVEALYTNGPAGGGGVSKAVNEIIAITSVLIDENEVHPRVHFLTI